MKETAAHQTNCVSPSNEPCAFTTLSAGSPASCSKPSMFWLNTVASTPLSCSSRKKKCVAVGACLSYPGHSSCRTQCSAAHRGQESVPVQARWVQLKTLINSTSLHIHTRHRCRMSSKFPCCCSVPILLLTDPACCTHRLPGLPTPPWPACRRAAGCA